MVTTFKRKKRSSRKAPLFHQMQQVLVGGGENPHVHLSGAGGADHADFLVLEHPEEFDLHGQAGLADFIQEDGAPVRRLEEPGAGFRGPGEGAFDMAEEFTLKQVFRNRSAVDGHKGC